MKEYVYDYKTANATNNPRQKKKAISKYTEIAANRLCYIFRSLS